MNILRDIGVKPLRDQEQPQRQEQRKDVHWRFGDEQRKKTFRRFGDAMLIEVVAIFSYAFYVGGVNAFLGVASVAIMLAGASALVAAAFGFLFGLPHTVQGTGAEAAQAAGDMRRGAGADELAIGYRMNTNLEQISDWLTKILVGVGLTQLGSIWDAFGTLTASAADGLGAGQSQPFVAALLIYSAIVGFLFGFLWTRLVMHQLLHVADVDVFAALKTKIEESARSTEARLQQSQDQKLDELQKKVQEQIGRDNYAMKLAVRQLSSNEPVVSQDELTQAVIGASPKARNEIFFYASPVVEQNKSDNKMELERALPVARALVAADDELLDHPSHNLLAVALLHKANPEYKEAENEFAVAIDIQNRLKEGRAAYYEYSHVLAMIAQEANMGRARSNPLRKTQILAALRAVFGEEKGLGEQLVSLEPVRDWIAANDVDEEDLRVEKSAAQAGLA